MCQVLASIHEQISKVRLRIRLPVATWRNRASLRIYKWQQEEYADALILIKVAQSVDTAAVAEEAGAAAAAGEAGTVDDAVVASFPVHRVILSVSPYFRVSSLVCIMS